MTAQELRKKYIEFFKSKGHAQIRSASVIPEHDPSVLFTTAGMHPLVPYLMGEEHPEGKRLTDYQKCIRTGDIDEVGDSTHHTFFEMLGNWSLNDYFKEEAITWSWEFLTFEEWLGLDKSRLAVSIFKGDADVPKDEEARDIWLSLGMPAERIAELGKEDNWWGPAGETGPCGPDTEMFYWVGNEQAPHHFDPEDDRWVEIWNDVFMQYRKTPEGNFELSEMKNIDTGMGLERTLAALNGLDDNYKTELFWPIIEKIQDITGMKYEDAIREFRVIADHIKAATMILADPAHLQPSNKDQGYVLRKLIRRAIRTGKKLGIEENFSASVAEVVIAMLKDVYQELETNKEHILITLTQEEEKFKKTLDKGLREFEKLDHIDGTIAFDLYQTYGFPLELTEELAKEKGMAVDHEAFLAEFKKHQDLSRTASAGKFKGGLADDSEMSTKYHTATHILHQVLRDVLGEEVEQKGSNINPERMRFDFNYPEKLSEEQKAEIEKRVNEQIQRGLDMNWEEMTVEEAREKGAIGVFDGKYGDKVKVYTLGDFSKEICGGPHVKNTKDMGTFKIKKEESVGAGIRRIKAVLE